MAGHRDPVFIIREPSGIDVCVQCSIGHCWYRCNDGRLYLWRNDRMQLASASDLKNWAAMRKGEILAERSMARRAA